MNVSPILYVNLFSSQGIFLWTVNKEDVKINATFKLVMNRFAFEESFLLKMEFTYLSRFLYPLTFEVEGFGYTLGSREDEAKLHYSVILFQPETIDEGSGNVELQPPPGIFCPRTTIHPPQTFPDFPNQFSVNIETLDSNNR